MIISLVLEAPIPKNSFGDKTSLYVIYIYIYICIHISIYIYIYIYIFRQAATFAQDWWAAGAGS